MRKIIKVLVPTMMAIYAYSNEIFVHHSVAEEWKPFTFIINGVLPNDTSLELYLLRGSEVIVFCYLPDPCEVTYDNRYNVTTKVQQSNFTLLVTIYNITRDGIWSSEGDWTVKTVDKANRKKYLTFILNIVGLGDDIQCQQIFNVHRTFISCSISQIYLLAKCQLLITLQETNVANYFNFFYTYDELSGRKTYINFTCSVDIPLLPPGDYQAMVTIYPNITGRLDDINHGRKRYFNFSVDNQPAVLENCPMVIQEGSEVNCSCKSIKSHTLLFVNWLDISDNMISDNEVITFIANRSQQAFRCQAVNDDGMKSPILLYKPQVINTKMSQAQCNYIIGEHMEVTCSIDKMYPTPICKLHLKSNKSVIFHPFDIKYQLSSEQVDAFFYNLKCIITVAVIYFEPGVYEYSVTVYPNVTGSDEDEIYGLNISFLYFHDYVANDYIDESHLHYLAPVIVAGTIVILCLMISALCIFRLGQWKNAIRPPSEELHVYDVLMTEKEISVYMNVKLNE